MNLCKPRIVTKILSLRSKPQQLATFLQNKLTEYTGKPKDLWTALRTLGLPSKMCSGEGNDSKKTVKLSIILTQF